MPPPPKKVPAKPPDSRDLPPLNFKDAVRQKPGMYLGGVGPHVLPQLIRHLIDWSFAQVPGYRELIEVDCSRENGRPRFVLTFHGLNSPRFRPDDSSDWMK